ncbi:MAG: adenylate/guanylate cyclase domain-containing protein [Caldimonas sp.]
MTPELQQLHASIAALERQRASLGDAVVDSALAPMRARIEALQAADALPAAAHTLKQVSILFMDVVGSTRMTQRLDPEDTSELMDGTLARAAAVVQAHRGRVLQYAGDSLLAAFGADHAAEDDAERAVRCGLSLCRLGRAVDADVRAERGDEGFAVRVGVHTGGVLLGGGVSDAGTIRGINVNIAARLEQTAPAGAVRISHDTYALVRGRFDVDAQPPLQVKGVDAALRSYLVVGEKPSRQREPPRGIDGVATTMIGRDDELEALQEAFKALAIEPTLTVVNVVGEAGLGKSRLVDEFMRWAEERSERPVVLRGGTTPQTPNRPFGLLGDVLTRHLQIAEDDTMEAAQRKVRRHIAHLLADADPAEADAEADCIAHLLGIEARGSSQLLGILHDPKQIRNRAFHAAALVLRRTATPDAGPLILLLEDLHWADDESLDFVSYLGDANRDVPMLVLAAMRPTLFERRHDALAIGGRQRRVDLAPLDRRASRELAHALMRKLPDIPAALRDLVTGAAEGNPFYMEELVRMLIDQGAIATGETWSLQAQALQATRLPPTLTGVLQARLDGLPAAEKLALQQASVIGPVFWDRALIALDARADAALPSLVGRGLVLPRSDSAVAGLAEYAFKHHLLHQAVYDTVLKRERRELHGRLAAWLTEQVEAGGVRAGDVLAIVAHHFEAAGDEARAAEFHGRAAEHAAERFAHAAVLVHAEQALALLDRVETSDGATPEQDMLRRRVLLAREKTYRHQGQRAEQRLDLQALGALAESSADDRLRAEVAIRCGLLAQAGADWPAAERHARQAMHWAGAAGDDERRLQALVTLAITLRGRGRLDDAFAIAKGGLADARERGLQRIAWGFLRALALITESQGDEVESAEMERQALHIARATADAVGEAIGLDCMGQGAILLGDLPEAQRSFEDALRLQRQLGLRGTEAHSLAYLAAVMLWRGDETRALAVARQALETAVASGARYAEAWAHYRLGEARSALGRHGEAALSFAAAAALAREIGIDLERTATAGLARAALARGDLATALGHVETLLAGPQPDVAAPDTTYHPELVALTCHQVLTSAGDPRAAQWLENAGALMRAVAGRIQDPAQRQAHLAAMPHRRAIAAAMERRGGSA